jgi:type VI secretion system protein ImpH
VSELLQREPFRFEFFQALRLLETLCREQYRTDPQTEPNVVQPDAPAGHPAVRLRAAASLAFPPAENVSLLAGTREADGEPRRFPFPYEMTVGFMGLTGPAGVLPLHYTTRLIDRCQPRHGDYALRDFLDIFNHRALSMLFGAWAKHFLPYAYEHYRQGAGPAEDLFTFCLRGLVGLGTRGLENRLGVDDETIIYYAGHFAHFPRPAVSLEQLLADYFGLPVQVQQFRGRWLNLSPEDRSRLPCLAQSRGQNVKLGWDGDLVLGTRIWDVQTKFRIRVGPLDYRQFLDFMPAGRGLRRLSDLTRLYVGPHVDFDVQLVLRHNEVPRTRLTFDRSAAQRLGWNSWLKREDFVRDTDQAVFRWQAI